MKKFNSLLILLTFTIPLESYCQDLDSKQYSDQKLIETAKKIITDAKTCALITIDNEGIPRARAMDGFAPEENLTIWFGTNSRSRKVAQIKKDPRVTLYYFDSDASSYVLIHGIAQLVSNPEAKEKYWKDAWEVFYPNIDKDYLLIKVVPQWMEVLSETYGITNNPITWEPPKVVF